MRFCLLLPLLFFTSQLHAQSLVGETHREAQYRGAAIRDAAHASRLRITVWYPAAPGSREQPVVVGPEAEPLFLVGSAALDATLAPRPSSGKRPLILLSHGYGGTARIMGWFGIALARAGYVVVAVDHPGNNAIDPMTVAGALLGWERAGDLRRAMEVVLADRLIGPHVDPERVGLAGFSLGGFTALVGAGARVDLARWRSFCASHPEDGVCKPQREFPVTADQRATFEKDPAYADVLRRAGDDHSIPGVRAVMIIAPALVQALRPTSLRQMRIPVAIVHGDADVVVPLRTNGEAAARLIPRTQLSALPGVGHYNFLANCAPRARLPICAGSAPQVDAHQAAIDAALRLFDNALQGVPSD